MKSSQFAFSTGALFPYNSEDALAMVKKGGFDYAELMPQAWSDASEASTLLFEKTGICLSSIHYPLVFFGMLYTSLPQMREDGRKWTLDLLKMGQRMGTKIVVVHPHNPTTVKGYEDVLDGPIIDNLRWLADACGDRGITLAMENNPNTCATPESLTAYVKMLNHPNIKPMVDTTEVREASGDPVAFIKACPPCHTHMSDYINGTKHLPAGEGDTDWKGVRAALTENYAGMLTLEPSYRFHMANPQEKIIQGYAFLQENFSD